METSKIVGIVIALAVGVIVLTTVLLPIITQATDSKDTEHYVGDTYAPLIGVVGIMGVLIIVMMAVRALKN